MGVRGVSGNVRSSRVKGEHLSGPGNSATRCLQLQGVRRMEVQIWGPGTLHVMTRSWA